MYRFRKIHHLLEGNHELEKQEIYFAPPEDLNDPMEGFRDIFWQGDAIVWRNMLKHYVICVDHIFVMTLISNDTIKLTLKDIALFNYLPTNLPQAKIDLWRKIRDEFFKNVFVNELPNALSRRKSPIRRDELLNYLFYVHQYALNAVSAIYHSEGMIPSPIFSFNIDEENEKLMGKGNMVDIVNRLEDEHPENKSVAEALFAASNQTRNAAFLATICNFTEEQLLSNRLLLMNNIPELFIKKLETLVYPEWYSASFLKECTNSAIWAHYGEEHKGCCLIFKEKAIEDRLEIDLELEYGANNSGPLTGFRSEIFREVAYENKYVEIDFFRSLGRSPIAFLESMWYKDENGNISPCADHLYTDQKEWHKSYWGNFFKSVVVKLDAWAYEKEYRVIITGSFTDYSSRESRKLKYKFDDLEGVIFGINTTSIDKIKIIKIIQEKCKQNGRITFDFYQAYYSNITGDIKKYKLGLIKFD
jgi:hypothetical protein